MYLQSSLYSSAVSLFKQIKEFYNSTRRAFALATRARYYYIVFHRYGNEQWSVSICLGVIFISEIISPIKRKVILISVG